MSRVERRLRRLLTLRALQHDATIIEVRAASALLEEAESGLRQGVQHRIDAHHDMANALMHHDHRDWLLACAKSELSKVSIGRCELGRENAARDLEIAVAKEGVARRELRQMELTLDNASKASAEDCSRAEQQQLDEAYRVVRAASSNPLNSGRFR